MELCMDEKWKLCKKGSRSSGVEGAFLKGSVSMREGRGDVGVGGAAAGTSFSSRCASLVKEQRARFYIMRRCVTMLICWKDYS